MCSSCSRYVSCKIPIGENPNYSKKHQSQPMAFADRPTPARTLPDLLAVDSEQDYSESDSDDSQEDPTFTEALSSLSRLSVRNKPSRLVMSEGRCKEGRRRLDDDLSDEVDGTVLDDELNDVDQKSFDCVQTLISGGNLEKLKVDQCKVYLRKYRLRLTGNKDTLIERIKEHLRILNGGGEREYPPSSFVLNCKGDACMGDVVMFEQRVYEKYDLASRSGPPVGTRIIAGRIVKESYGAAKQQHTFTIEVLWSKGEKPLPPLHPLLIKGRNLYRMKTLRQRWEDESLREEAVRDKHSRGDAARNNREMRVLEKKMKQELRGKRQPRMKNSDINQDPSSLPARTTQLQAKYHPLHHNQPTSQPDTVADRIRLKSIIIPGANCNHYLPTLKSPEKHSLTNNGYRQAARGQGPAPAFKSFETVHSRGMSQTVHRQHLGSSHGQNLGLSQTVHRQHLGSSHGQNLGSSHDQNLGLSQTVHSHYHRSDKGSAGSHHGMARRPLATQNYEPPPTSSWVNVDHHGRPYNEPPCPNSRHHVREYHQHQVRQPCRYFAHGRCCPYGSNCKFSHDI